ncbi:hypothetical protein [Filimonas effusa]|uniref:Uncharacterized protein n=1 Tax=Filimonas effusa TaxID=2508721 RepID=A0A4Q1D9Y8_9BACT|nr:hypothetical protein [Filimonas effusa]RXK86181.1 hypothetical protein ESB13_05050 [Filimonas effusa]
MSSVPHSFHIPVLGLGYTMDTPIKVARYGISSVISIVDDQLIEKMRGYYALHHGKAYTPITEDEHDFRAKRTTSYLNLVQELVQEQMATLKTLPFGEQNDLAKYFELLPEDAALKLAYQQMLQLPGGEQKQQQQEMLRNSLVAGSIDVNIMVKVDKMNTDADGNMLPSEYSDALASLRGFAQSDLNAGVVLSAGYNPRLYNYIDQFPDFFPDENGNFRKKIILKVSDYRSALVQGKILAKKGIWVSEFRIESGLNCGGHAFATDGLLLGPILEEFKTKRTALATELGDLCNNALAAKELPVFTAVPELRITVQGGIGTANEQAFLLEYYDVNATGWGSPFLLVPEATSVDASTLQQLATASKDDYFMSDASPLGVPFHNFRISSSEDQRKERIQKARPGSPCYKKFLVTDTEFTSAPICTGSRQYQNLKLKQLNKDEMSAEEYQAAMDNIVVKDCLCEGLGASALLKNEIPLSHNLGAVTICPGPNLAYFSGVFSLAEMVGHIYGRINLLNSLPRPHMFINELHLYIDYFKKKLDATTVLNPKQEKYLQTFKSNLLEGIQYYKDKVSLLKKESSQYLATMKEDLEKASCVLKNLSLTAPQPVPVPVAAR